MDNQAYKQLIKEDSQDKETQLNYSHNSFRIINGVKTNLEKPDSKILETIQYIRSKDTLIETLIENELKNQKLPFTKPDLIIGYVKGKPHFVIPRYKIAIFCDRDFWHENDFYKNRIKSNQKFLAEKMKSNVVHDSAVNEYLNKNDWKVFRFWEHEIHNNVHYCINKIRRYIADMPVLNPKFTFVDLFAGIGGFRIPLEKLGGKCLGFSEIDKKAIETYKLNFVDPIIDDELELGDITKLNKLPFDKIDLIVGGVPCQSWSVAGKMRGFEDPRGKLWEDSIRLVQLNKPKAFIFENVKGLIDPRNKANLELIVNSLKKAGYKVVPPQLLNSYDFGVPQNRDRIFIVGFRNDIELKGTFEYPRSLKINTSINEILDSEVSPNNAKKKKINPIEIHGEKIPKARNRFQKEDELNDFFVFCDTRNGHTTIHSWDLIRTTKREKEICLTILKNRRKKKYGPRDGNPLNLGQLKVLISELKESELNKLIEKNILKKIPGKGYDFVNSKNSSGINGIYRVYLPQSKIFSTLTATGTKDMIALETIEGDDPITYKENFIKEIYIKKKLRSINGRESGKLQGFPNHFAVHENEMTAKKQFGNAVSVPVIYNLALSLIQTGIIDG